MGTKLTIAVILICMFTLTFYVATYFINANLSVILRNLSVLAEASMQRGEY